MLKNLGSLSTALLAGFVGGFVSGHLPHGTIKAREFLVVDAAGKARAAFALLPDARTAPTACRVCDGGPHVIVIDQREQVQMWPQQRGPISAEQVMEFIKLLKVAGML